MFRDWNKLACRNPNSILHRLPRKFLRKSFTGDWYWRRIRCSGVFHSTIPKKPDSLWFAHGGLKDRHKGDRSVLLVVVPSEQSHKNCCYKAKQETKRTSSKATISVSWGNTCPGGKRLHDPGAGMTAADRHHTASFFCVMSKAAALPWWGSQHFNEIEFVSHDWCSLALGTQLL